MELRSAARTGGSKEDRFYTDGIRIARSPPNLALDPRARVAGAGGATARRRRDCGGVVRVRAAGRCRHRAVGRRVAERR